MYPAQARRYYQLKHSLDEDLTLLADKGLNPSASIVTHMRKNWIDKAHGGLDDTLFSKRRHHERKTKLKWCQLTMELWLS